MEILIRADVGGRSLIKKKSENFCWFGNSSNPLSTFFSVQCLSLSPRLPFSLHTHYFTSVLISVFSFLLLCCSVLLCCCLVLYSFLLSPCLLFPFLSSASLELLSFPLSSSLFSPHLFSSFVSFLFSFFYHYLWSRDCPAGLVKHRVNPSLGKLRWRLHPCARTPGLTDHPKALMYNCPNDLGKKNQIEIILLLVW